MSPAKQTCQACGCPVGGDGTDRSWQQLKLYHRTMAAWLTHWPEACVHQFSNVTEMRKFLEMSAGHREVGASIPISGMRKEQAMMLAEAAIRASGSYALPRLHGDVLVIFRPKSVALHSMSSQDFSRLFDGVKEVFHKETGLDPDEVLRMTEGSA